jgi:hypothetical protein
LRWDPEDGFEVFWDGSDHGLTANIDGFSTVDDGSLLMSLASNASVAGVGPVSHADVLRWHEEEGFSLWFDGSDIGLTTTNENVDAIDGQAARVFLSTTGSVSASGGINGLDEDLLDCVDGTRGPASACAALGNVFDGGDNGLAADSEDVSGLSILGPDIYLSMSGNWSVPGLSGANEDVLACLGGAGDGTCDDYELYLDGGAAGLPASATLDAIHVPAAEN